MAVNQFVARNGIISLSNTQTTGSAFISCNLAVGSGAVASGTYSSVAGGCSNCANGNYSFIGGGCTNTASGACSTVAGGASNLASGTWAIIGGGYANQSVASMAGTFSGQYNSSCANYSYVGGGYLNTTCGNYSSALGGRGNTVSGAYSSAVGCGLTASVACTFYANNICACSNIFDAGITSGCAVCVSTGGQLVGYTAGVSPMIADAGTCSIRGNGCGNSASGNCTFVGGGVCNTASSQYAFVGGGSCNSASCPFSSVLTGCKNCACGNVSSVLGGQCNTISGGYSSIVGGICNQVSNSTIVNCSIPGYLCVTSSASGYSGFICISSQDFASCFKAGSQYIYCYCGIASPPAITPNGCLTFTSLCTTSFGVTCINVCNVQSYTFRTCCSVPSCISCGAMINQSVYAGSYAFVGNGCYNINGGQYSGIGAGSNNLMQSNSGNSFIAAGGSNVINNIYSFIGAGTSNRICGSASAIVSGYNNCVSTTSYASIVGGFFNLVSNTYTFIGGGYTNCATGLYSSILGGLGNTASGAYSSAVGCCVNNACACTFMSNCLRACNLIGTTVALCVGTDGIIVRGSSDCRLKTQICPITYGINTVSQLNPVSFYWNDREKDVRGCNKQIGFIAQEVEPIIPEAVGQRVDNGEYSLSPDKIIPVLTKAIQELKAENDALLARVIAIEGILAKNNIS